MTPLCHSTTARACTAVSGSSRFRTRERTGTSSATRYERSLPIDPCIGRLLPGVVHCCCGHGVQRDAYVTLSDELPPGAAVGPANDRGFATRRLGGREALEYLRTVHGCGPPTTERKT